MHALKKVRTGLNRAELSRAEPEMAQRLVYCTVRLLGLFLPVTWHFAGANGTLRFRDNLGYFCRLSVIFGSRKLWNI